MLEQKSIMVGRIDHLGRSYALRRSALFNMLGKPAPRLHPLRAKVVSLYMHSVDVTILTLKKLLLEPILNILYYHYQADVSYVLH